jgi:hypothetical protein
MLRFLMHNRTGWNDYFTGTPTLMQQRVYESTQTLSGTNVHVLNCLFKSITSSNRGGAFYCTSVSYLLVESSSFFSCKTTRDYGGAIFFENGNGQCVLHEICGFDCCSTNTGSSSCCQNVYIYVNNAASSKNYINYSSIVRCVNVNLNSYYTMYLQYGKVCCPSVNISMNECQYYSGIYSNPLRDSNSFTGLFSYCSITDNIANGHTCIRSWWGNINIEFKSCNILRNTQGTLSSGGTIYTHDNINILDSCILENKATYIFNQAYSSNRVTVSNCTLDSTSKTGNVVIQSTATKSFIHALNHMSTLNCNSEYDSVGTLTAIIQSPSPSKKPIICFTYGKILCQPRVFDFVSFSIIFIFNFIHPSPSCDLLF